MAVFQVPQEDIKRLKTILQLNKDSRKRLVDFLYNVPIGCWGDDLNKLISENVEIKIDDAKDIADFLFSFSINNRYFDSKSKNFVNDLISTLKELNDPNLIIDEDAVSFITEIGSFQRIRITAKAIELKFDREKLLKNTRIITDIRPIFDDQNSSEIKANLILHSLKITFTDNDGDHEIYFALDNEDLSKLKEQILRAENKEVRIRQGIGEVEFISSKL